MAPEILGWENEVDEKCDVWSLGVVLYVVLTGRTPFPNYKNNLRGDRTYSDALLRTRIKDGKFREYSKFYGESARDLI